MFNIMQLALCMITLLFCSLDEKRSFADAISFLDQETAAALPGGVGSDAWTTCSAVMPEDQNKSYNCAGDDEASLAAALEKRDGNYKLQLSYRVTLFNGHSIMRVAARAPPAFSA